MKRTVLSVIVLVLFFQPLLAGEKEDVGRFIKETVGSILEIARQDDISDQSKKDQIMKIVEPAFDLKLMAKLTLGRKHWPKLNPEQRKVFTDLFIRQIQASYFDKVDLLSKEKVAFDDPIKKKTKYMVLSHVLSKDDALDLAYKLFKNKKGRWRVYDVEIEGVSIIKSYGLQYSQVLQEGTAEDLLMKMEKKIDELEKAANKDEKNQIKESKATTGDKKSSVDRETVERSSTVP